MIARFALQHQVGLYPSHFDELMSLACWKVTEAGGKYRTRYFTRASMERGAKRQHEHVITRLDLRNAMRNHPNNCDKILALAIACVVTPGEHKLLDDTVFGWHRYRDLGLDILDRETGEPADLKRLAQELDAAWKVATS